MLTTNRISSNIETVRDKNIIQKKLMNNLHSYTNYITGTELEDGKILLYAGKTRRGVEERKKGKFATGAIPQGDGSYIQSAWGYDGRLFDTIHANGGTKNDKLTEQNTITKTANTQEVKGKEASVKSEETALLNYKEDFATTGKELDAVLSYLDKLKPQCETKASGGLSCRCVGIWRSSRRQWRMPRPRSTPRWRSSTRRRSERWC